MHPRHIAPLLLDALSDTPVVVLNGARQSGKSTLVQSLTASPASPQIAPRQYLTLDDAVVLNAAKSDPAGFINALPGPVTLDEVQRAPELFLAIKAAVDRNRQPGRYLLTGSADVLLLPGIADSLAGRVEVLSLWPLSSAALAVNAALNRADGVFQGDLAALAIAPCDRSDLIARLLAGGFPDAITRSNASRRTAWFDSYVQSILQRDVRDLANIEQLTEIPNLLQLLATRSATLLNFAELSRSCGLPQSTLKRYFALLEMLFLVVRLPSWERNAGKRLVKAPKVFLPDSGLLCHFMGETSNGLAARAGLPGSVVETFVLALTSITMSLPLREANCFALNVSLEMPQASARDLIALKEISRACSLSPQTLKLWIYLSTLSSGRRRTTVRLSLYFLAVGSDFTGS